MRERAAGGGGVAMYVNTDIVDMMFITNSLILHFSKFVLGNVCKFTESL